MSEKIITKARLESFLKNFGIRQGSTVLLQADLRMMPQLIGHSTTLIETLISVIGPRGTLIIPSFTREALDPACRLKAYPYPLWQTVRFNHPGFSSRTMPADLWPDAANAFLLHTRVKRTEHPVYSFAWTGSLPYKPALETLDYPISFTHVLSEMKRDQAINLLIGVDVHEAIYPMLIGHELGIDTVSLESAFVRRVRKTFEETFLTGSLDQEAWKEACSYLDIEQKDLNGVPVYKIMQKPQMNSAAEPEFGQEDSDPSLSLF